ncbi:hypothetical protein V5799_014020 [Amblyomma americanum]|uniref:Uncharacterized protein n=1 Tax=Amblyomma americanum TaxID=6943 RepID=A0AAQ4E489_AMBAM
MRAKPRLRVAYLHRVWTPARGPVTLSVCFTSSAGEVPFQCAAEERFISARPQALALNLNFRRHGRGPWGAP